MQHLHDHGVRWLTAIALTILGLLCASAAHATPDNCKNAKIRVAPGVEQIDLATCLWFLEDPENSLSLEQIRKRDAAGGFQKHDGGILNFGYTTSAFWARFDLIYTGSEQAERFLELNLPLVDNATLYLYRDDVLFEERNIGYSSDWSTRELEVPNPVFKVQLKPDEPVRVYLRVHTTNAFRLPLTLWTPDAYLKKVTVDEVIQGIFLGALLALFAYNLFVAVSVRERGNIYYVLYLVFITLFITTALVHGQQLFDKHPWFLDKQYLQYHIQLAWLFGILMAREVLETRQRSEHLDKVMRVALSGLVVTLVLSTLMPYHIVMEWTLLGTLILSVVMILVSYWSWKHHNPAARSYFLAWTAAISCYGLYVLTVVGLVPLNAFTEHAPQIGITAQTVLFSFTLADRIKLIQAESLDWNQRAIANLRRYQLLFRNAVEGIFQMTLERRFEAANPAIATMLGFSGPKLMVRQVRDVLATCFADEAILGQVIEQLESKGGVHSVETRCFTPYGEERWLSVSLNTVYDMDGVPSHLEGTCIDITERKQRTQIEKERENERIEKEMARSSAQAKSNFLANMSHEIRTPLAAIIGYGETLLEPQLSDAEKRNSAETVVRSGRHLLDLVNDILDHSKIDANQLNVEILTVNLPELLDEIRAFFAPRAREKSIDFNISCEFPLPETIQTDPTRLRQIIINLCGNALKFTERGTISMTIRCQREPDMLVARIVDSGIGMKPEQLDRLFDPFAQGSSSIARQYGGTGLGLSISRRLAELLGGAISVDSVYGEGSEFEVTIGTGALDGVHLLRDASELTQRRRQLPMVAAPRLSGRILCAEDNDVNRKLVDLLIARTGAQVDYANNGVEALEAAQHGDYDLILMDIQMPVMNGRDATVAIREAGINAPIIALTANVMAEDVEDYRRAGCTDHLAKPIDKRRLYEALARYLTLDEWPSANEERQYQGTVLVAEDNDDNRRLVARLLARFGLNVLTVTSGREAVQVALSKTVHLVLMDRHMPEMSGPKATRMLRQTGFRRPVIAFTAGDQSEIDNLVEAGCDDVLNKPIDNSHLAALLARHLDAQTDKSVGRAAESDGISALVTQFLEGLPERRAIMARAVSEQAWSILQRHAHQIKGTAGAMGYPLMTEQAGHLENALKKGQMAQVEPLHGKLGQSIDKAIQSGLAASETPTDEYNRE